MEIRIAILEDFDVYQAGQIVLLDTRNAEFLVKSGKACYYSEFSTDMLNRNGAQNRVTKAPETMTEEPSPAPSKGRKRSTSGE